MHNEWLWLIFLVLDLCVAMAMVRFFGKNGLFFLIVVNIILCNIQVLKTVELFGMTATLGNILYGSIFFATDILSEVYGKREAQKGVILGFCALLMTTVYMQLSLLFQPAPSDFSQPHLEAIFHMLPRIAIGSLCAYLISQFHDVWAFQMWKKKTRGRFLWFRNNMSTAVSQLIDSFTFCLIAFAGLFEWSVWWEILLTTYLLKIIVALFDTPFIYLGRRIAMRAKEEESKRAITDAGA